MLIVSIIILIIISYLLKVICYFTIFITLILIIIYIFTRNKSKRNDIILFIVSILFLLRISGMAFGFLYINNTTPPPKNVHEIYKKMGVFWWTAYADSHSFGVHLIERRRVMNDYIYSILGNNEVMEKIKEDKASTGTLSQFNDIYDESRGIKWKKKEGKIFLYSLGPDQDDDNMKIIYDPTNGFYSNGDML